MRSSIIILILLVSTSVFGQPRAGHFHTLSDGFVSQYLRTHLGLYAGNLKWTQYFRSRILETNNLQQSFDDLIQEMQRSTPKIYRSHIGPQVLAKKRLYLLQTFSCVKDAIKKRRGGAIGLRLIAKFLDTPQSQWNSFGQVFQKKLDCEKKLSRLTPHNIGLSDYIHRAENIPQKPRNFAPLVQIFLYPQLIACKEFSITEVSEQEGRKPFRWGWAHCVREDGRSWKEWVRGHAGREYPVTDVADIVDKLFSDSDDEAAEPPEEDDLGILDQAGSFYSYGVKYRWQPKTSTTELEYVATVYMEAHYSRVYDDRFVHIYGAPHDYEHVYHGYGMGSFEKARGFAYRNGHYELWESQETLWPVIQRFFHPRFVYKPFPLR